MNDFLNARFPSGRTVGEVFAADPCRSIASAGGRRVGLEPSTKRLPASGASLAAFERCAEAYASAQRSATLARIHLQNARCVFDAAADEYGAAVQAKVAARERFRRAAAGIDPDTGLTLDE